MAATETRNLSSKGAALTQKGATRTIGEAHATWARHGRYRRAIAFALKQPETIISKYARSGGTDPMRRVYREMSRESLDTTGAFAALRCVRIAQQICHTLGLEIMTDREATEWSAKTDVQLECPDQSRRKVAQ